MNTQLYFPELESDSDLLDEITNISRLYEESELNRVQIIASAHQVGSFLLSKKAQLQTENKRDATALYRTYVEERLSGVLPEQLSLCCKVAKNIKQEEIEKLGSKEVARLIQGLQQSEMKSIVDQAETVKRPVSVLDVVAHLEKAKGTIDKMGGVSSLTSLQLNDARAAFRPYKSLLDEIYEA